LGDKNPTSREYPPDEIEGAKRNGIHAFLISIESSRLLRTSIFIFFNPTTEEKDIGRGLSG
jgi:hypothetical protein